MFCGILTGNAIHVLALMWSGGFLYILCVKLLFIPVKCLFVHMPLFCIHVKCCMYFFSCFQVKCGSFLSRSKATLTRLQSQTSAALNLNGSTRSFVFQKRPAGPLETNAANKNVEASAKPVSKKHVYICSLVSFRCRLQGLCIVKCLGVERN